MVCPGCSADNPEGKKFCGECGAALAEKPAPVPVAGEDGAWFCQKHAKTVTRLRCGRCEAPICTKCTVYTPAGTRCRACAKNKIAVRPAGLLHEAVGTLSGPSSGIGQRVWYLVLWYGALSLIRMVIGLFFRNPGEW